MTNKIVIRFPFPVRQTEDNSVEINLDHNGVQLPFLETHEPSAKKFDETFGLDMSEHGKIIEEMNERYQNNLIRAVTKVIRVKE